MAVNRLQLGVLPRWASPAPEVLAAVLGAAVTALAAGGAPESAPAPVFSISGGVFTNAIQLALSAGTGTVRYTIDGSEPEESSRAASGPLRVTNCVLVRARTFAPGRPASSTVSQAYTLLAADLLGFTSNLPLVVLNTYGEEISGDNRANVTVRVIELTGGRAALTGAEDHDGRGVVNIRGHASRRYPKNSFTLRTIDELDDKQRVSILGLPKENEWILYAPYPDKTLMRDVLAYELSNRAGRWAPHTRHVELFLHDGRGPLSRSDYHGVYVFEERISRDKNRLNLKRLNPDDTTEPAITGGYLIKKDHVGRGQRAKAQAERLRKGPDAPAAVVGPLPSGPGGFPGDPAGFLPTPTNQPGPAFLRRLARSRKLAAATEQVESVTNYVGFFTRRATERADRTRGYSDAEITPDPDGFTTGLQGVHYFYVEPEPDELTAVQRAWLNDHFNEFEHVLGGPDFKDPARGYAAFIDPGSFIDHHLIEEVCKNVDAYRYSTFFHKDRGGRIQMGPIWDMNLTLGNCRALGVHDPEHWMWPQFDDQGYSYFRRLFEDPDFAQRYVDRWAELRAGVWATSNVLAFIDQTAARLDEAQRRNFQRWPILGEDVKPNHFVGSNYVDEVRWLREWVEKRLGWIDKQFLAPPGFSEKVEAAQRRIELTAPVAGAKVYYTLDGADPRAPGGEPAGRSTGYSAPVTLTDDSRMIARVRLGTRWSAPVRPTK